MFKDEFVGEAFLLDNNKEYIIISTCKIDNEIYAFMVNEKNVIDVMLGKIIYNSSDLYVEEVHNPLIIQQIIQMIKNNK